MLAAQNEQRAEGGDGGGALKQPHFNSFFSFDDKCFTFLQTYFLKLPKHFWLCQANLVIVKMDLIFQILCKNFHNKKVIHFYKFLKQQ